MAIQMRRGNKADFDPSKMLPGEWAVAIDSDTQNQIVWMCFRAGVVKRMGTYEDFKEQIKEATAEIKNEYKEEFQTIFDEIEKLAEQTSKNKDTVIQIRDDTVNTYLPKMLEYMKKSETAATKAETSQELTLESATKAQSYAVGGTGSREGEDSDNAKYYYQQAKDVSEGLKGGLQPHGTVAFADLPALADVSTGWMFNISDEFTTTDDFKEGAGNVIPAGANIYKTSDEKWDVLAGTPVTGIKGTKEKVYRRGNVNLTPENIGAFPISGGKLTGQLQVGEKVKLYTSNEGGNIQIISPDDIGLRWELDAFKGDLRFICFNNDGTVKKICQLTKDGTLIANNATQSAAGLMSPKDKEKLDNLSDNVVAVGADTTENITTFSAASARENIKSGEKHNILFGKIAKWFADLKTVAFSGSYNDLSNKPTIPTVGNGTVTIIQNGATKGSFTMNQSGNTTVKLTDNNTTYDLSKYLALTGGTVTGTLVLSKTTDLSGTSDNRPALIVGGAATEVHIEIDNNEIQGKKNEKTPNQIVINADGGDVTIGDTANEYSTTIRNDLIVNKNFYPENSIKMNQSKWLDCIVNYIDSNGAGRVDALHLIGCNSSGNVHMGGYSDVTIAPVYLHASGKQYNFTDIAFCPSNTNDVSLGLSSKLWKTVYAKTGTINTSDRTKKHDIKDLTEVYEKLFLKLQPKSFIFNDGERVHIGAISQDVEDAMQKLGIEPEKFAGFCKDIRYEYTEYNEEDGMPIESSKVPCKDEDGNIIYDYALRYQEFIFLTVHMVQKLWKRVDVVEKENAEIKEQIRSMRQDIEELKKVRA